MVLPIKNPNLILKPKRIGNEILALVSEAPVKERGLLIHKIKKSDDPELFQALFTLFEKGDGEFQGLLKNGDLLKRLEEMGIAVDPSRICRPVYFSSRLEASTLEELPLRYRKAPVFPGAGEERIVHPSFLFQEDGEIPPSIRHRVLWEACFEKGSPLVWIEEPFTHLLAPYWVQESDRKFFARLRPGETPSSSMDPVKRNLLEMARILVPPSYVAASERNRAAVLEAGAQDFQARDYTVLEEVLPPLQLAGMRRYYRDRVAEGWVHWGEPWVQRRFHGQDDPLSSFFHRQMVVLASRLAAKPLKPSYNYVSTYLPGAELKAHTDTEQHPYGMTLLVDFEPKPEGKSPWPIELVLTRPEEKKISLFQSPGEALFYRGSELIHSRPPLPDGQRSTSLLLHFLPADFSGEMEYSPYYY